MGNRPTEPWPEIRPVTLRCRLCVGIQDDSAEWVLSKPRGLAPCPPGITGFRAVFHLLWSMGNEGP